MFSSGGLKSSGTVRSSGAESSVLDCGALGRPWQSCVGAVSTSSWSQGHTSPSISSFNELMSKLKVGYDGKLANAANQDFPSPSAQELVIRYHGLGHIQSDLPGPEVDLLVECDLCCLIFKDFQGIAMQCECSRKLLRWCHLGDTDLNA